MPKCAFLGISLTNTHTGFAKPHFFRIPHTYAHTAAKKAMIGEIVL